MENNHRTAQRSFDKGQGTRYEFSGTNEKDIKPTFQQMRTTYAFITYLRLGSDGHSWQGYKRRIWNN